MSKITGQTNTKPANTPKDATDSIDRRFCVAPMLDWSDRHCRYFWRLLSDNAVLYTEMVTTGALIHGEQKRFLEFDPAEQPIALQLGGSHAKELAHCAEMAENWGYNEVNLNCGCPSDRVQSGAFGACLMATPQVVADAVKAMQDAVSLPITVKNRIGIDDMEEYSGLCDFVGTVADSGCQTFIVHARKAWLKGLSPKQNRDVPPLRYELVYQLKKDFPHLEIILNGGITTLEQSQEHIQHVDGVMMGREVYSNPGILGQVDSLIYQSEKMPVQITEVLPQLYDYIERELGKGTRLNHITRHILGLFNGQAGARLFRRHLSENAYKPDAGIEVLEAAFSKVLERQQAPEQT